MTALQRSTRASSACNLATSRSEGPILPASDLSSRRRWVSSLIASIFRSPSITASGCRRASASRFLARHRSTVAPSTVSALARPPWASSSSDASCRSRTPTTCSRAVIISVSALAGVTTGLSTSGSPALVGQTATLQKTTTARRALLVRCALMVVLHVLRGHNVSDNAAGSKRDRAKRASRPVPARVHPFVRPQSAI